MRICLKTAAQQNVTQAKIQLHERLPERVHNASEVTVAYDVTNQDIYYLLTLDVRAVLTVNCQRCLHPFQHDYCNQTTLAVCTDDEIAESLMEQWECIVASNNEVELVEILTDELHLSAPEKHENFADCNSEMKQWIENKDEICW